MIIGFRKIEIHIPNAHSLKEKRSVLRPIKDKVKNKFNVSYSEIDYHDKWQRSVLGFVTISNSRVDVDGRLDSIQRLIEEKPEIMITNIIREYL